MSFTLLVNTTPEERRVAMIEGRTVREFYSEHRYDRGLVGNIYKGRILRVMPGMDAAFVEIGVGRSGFLQMGDALVPSGAGGGEDGEARETGEDATEDGLELSPVKDWLADRPRPAQLQVGTDVLVQVTRDAFGGKGPRLTTQISLPGRNVVFFPATPILGVSRRIRDDDERARLRDTLRGLLRPGTGAILRTAALRRPAQELAEDLSFQAALWQRIEQFAADLHSPALVHEDLDLLLRTARDLLTEGCERIIVDTEADYDRLLQFVDSFMPQLDHLVEYEQAEEPVFERYGVEFVVGSLLERVVWLKSGGSIVIDHSEALTAIDVNTGSSPGKGDPEDVILKTNLEAAREIADQLRLRNIGGIVVIDFIDMRDLDSRSKVYETLVTCLRNDRTHTDVLPMSSLGLVELTRKRDRDASFSRLTERCPCCEGRGWVRSSEHVAAEIVRKLGRELRSPSVRGVAVLAHPRVVDTLVEVYRMSLADLETGTQKPVRLLRRDEYHVERYTIRRD